MTPRSPSPLRRALAVVAAAGVLAMAPAAEAMTGTNLVVHGDAEATPGGEWVVTGGPLLRQPYGSAHFPDAVLIGGGTFDGGTSLLQGSGDATEAVQTIDLTPEDRVVVATGTVRARLSAFVGGYISQPDQVGVTAVWRDADGAGVATQTLAPVTPAERGNVSGFLRREDVRSVPADAVSVDVTLSGSRVEGTSQDGYVDNVALHLLGVPGVAVAAAPEPATAGRPTAVTWTIANSEDLEAKPPWRFRVALPEGMALASSRPVRTTCDAARVTADHTVLAVDGALPVGAPACTVTAAVVAPEGRYVFAPDDVRDVDGLRPPTVPVELVVRDDGGPGLPGALPEAPGPVPPPSPTVLAAPVPSAPPVVRPSPPPAAPAPAPAPARLPSADEALVLRAVAPGARLRLGRRTTVGVRVQNRATTALTGVDVCARLPHGLLYLPTRSGPAPVDGRRCWTVRRLPAGASRTLRLSAKAVRRGGATVRLTAEAAEVDGTATTDRTTRVTR